jgi:hypothetical protein
MFDIVASIQLWSKVKACESEVEGGLPGIMGAEVTADPLVHERPFIFLSEGNET